LFISILFVAIPLSALSPKRISVGLEYFSLPEEIDSLEYSRVKDTSISVRLRIYLLFGAIAGDTNLVRR
jgi:hypothetical protein